MGMSYSIDELIVDWRMGFVLYFMLYFLNCFCLSEELLSEVHLVCTRPLAGPRSCTCKASASRELGGSGPVSPSRRYLPICDLSPLIIQIS